MEASNSIALIPDNAIPTAKHAQKVDLQANSLYHENSRRGYDLMANPKSDLNPCDTSIIV